MNKFLVVRHFLALLSFDHPIQNYLSSEMSDLKFGISIFFGNTNLFMAQ
uniref:Uncharacterized protein n=1 Tax=Anguilla anguilla TaxID=7936 RepID=A0A0E9XC77_ANGAN